jgi:hypothetical protein
MNPPFQFRPPEAVVSSFTAVTPEENIICVLLDARLRSVPDCDEFSMMPLPDKMVGETVH